MDQDIFADSENNIANVYNPIIPEEGIGLPSDPLALNIPDDELIKVVDKKIEDSKRFWKEKYSLADRRKKMERALFGRDIAEKERNQELKKYESRYSDNALYEIEATLKPVAMSHLPDLIVSPGNDTPESQLASEDISKAVNDDIKKRKNRQVLGLAFKHLPVYLTSIIKAQWNPEIDDYEFINVHPDNIVISKSATGTNADYMDFVAEVMTLTVQELVMRFPEKKQKLFEILRAKGLVVGEDEFTWKDLATEVKIWEVWFTWYKKADLTDEEQNVSDNSDTMGEPGNKWERVEGVLWKYGEDDLSVVLKKIKNPNFDYEGDTKLFTYDDISNESTKRELRPEEMLMGALTGQLPPGTQQEQIYYNYFQYPRKPYFFMGYDQWGKVAIDETSRIEQNIYNQNSLNDQGKQIMDTLKQRVKHIWSTDSGLDAEAVQGMDMENPKLDALVDGNVNETHAAIVPERPDVAQFNALKQTKDNMFASAGATSLTGIVQSDVATTNQIAREQNFTRADDLVSDTTEAASEWMAQWSMQFIKLRYTDEHMRKLLGKSGQFTFLKLKRDQIDDGMEVIIKSSGTDKLKAQQNAMDMAKLGPPYVNPMDFFKDMDISDPEGRTERGMTLMIDPNLYMAQYVMGLKTVTDQANALNGQPPQGAQTPATSPGSVPPPGGLNAPTTAPVGPSPVDTSAMPTNPTPTAMGAPMGSPRNL